MWNLTGALRMTEVAYVLPVMITPRIELSSSIGLIFLIPPVFSQQSEFLERNANT